MGRVCSTNTVTTERERERVNNYIFIFTITSTTSTRLNEDKHLHWETLLCHCGYINPLMFSFYLFTTYLFSYRYYILLQKWPKVWGHLWSHGFLGGKVQENGGKTETRVEVVSISRLMFISTHSWPYSVFILCFICKNIPLQLNLWRKKTCLRFYSALAAPSGWIVSLHLTNMKLLTEQTTYWWFFCA